MPVCDNMGGCGKREVWAVEIDSALATKLALACRILAMSGHGDLTLGHVTARRPGDSYLYMKPAGLGLEEVTPEDIIVIDLEGNKVFGQRQRHSEYPIHTEIYKEYQYINCVIHTHPFYATILGASNISLKPISQDGVLFTNIPVFDETTELIRTSAQGQAVARRLNGHRALLLRNHGVVVVGNSVEEATVYAFLLERAAKVQVVASLLGSTSYSSEEENSRKLEQIYHPANIQAFWDYLVRRLSAKSRG